MYRYTTEDFFQNIMQDKTGDSERKKKEHKFKKTEKYALYIPKDKVVN